MNSLHEQGGVSPLEEEAPSACLDSAVNVLIEIEGGDHHHRDRVVDVGAGELTRGFDAADLGHADVEQADVGTQLAGEGDRLASVAGFADDLDVCLRIEDHPEPGADELLVVGDDHTDGHLRVRPVGTTAVTVQPPPGFGPAWRVPPRSVARSVMERISSSVRVAAASMTSSTAIARSGSVPAVARPAWAWMAMAET